MCGRFVRHTNVHELTRLLGADWSGPELPPSYNIAPTQNILAVRRAGDHREAVLLRWGLIPHWAKDKAIGARMINARAEGIAEKPAFRAPFRHQRCLIPADGFYEWKREGSAKQPYYIHRRDGKPLVFAGLWAHWHGEETIESCAIITGPANAALAPIHDRMPVILAEDDQSAWLDNDNPLLLEQLLRLHSADLLEAWPVSKAVNKPQNQRPDLIDPL